MKAIKERSRNDRSKYQTCFACLKSIDDAVINGVLVHLNDAGRIISDSVNNIVLSDGMRQEFDLCREVGVLQLPIGATGYIAEDLWKKVWTDFGTYYPGVSPMFKSNFKKLGDKSLATSDLISTILGLIQDIQRS